METEILGPDAAGITRAVALLQQGQAIALPTETVYGLAADALDSAAVARIYQAKGRPSDNPLIVHVTGPAQAEQIAGVIPESAYALMTAFWPGPLTIVLPKRSLVPDITTGGRPDVGLRAPAHPAFQAVLAASGLALAAPSANRAGRPSPTTAQHVLHDMSGVIPAILDGGPSRVGLESTVISVIGPQPSLLRPGGISLEQLEAVVGPVSVDQAVTESLAAGRAPGAPGMKYQHYAPRTPLTLMTGSLPNQRDWVQLQAEKKPTGVLAFDDEASWFTGISTLTYGARHDAASQAQRLFSSLHDVDNLGVEQVFVQFPVETSGVFLAVRNRLLKAAGHQIITLPGG